MTSLHSISNLSTESNSTSQISRRDFAQKTAMGTAAAVATLVTLKTQDATAKDTDALQSFTAFPPAGFTSMAAPGFIVKVSKKGSLQPNGLYPYPEAASQMLERALKEFTGAATLADALKKFIHPEDKVAVKLNGIAKQGKFGTNKELVDALLKGLIEAGIPATSIVVYEQYPSFLAGTRVSASNVPQGVRTMVHRNKDMLTPHIPISDGKREIPTKFARPLMEATAVINLSLIKDHSICGYTGCLKNMTHGSNSNPHDFHDHCASPQIAKLYAHEAIKSRVRLHITDGYKIMYQGGPVEVTHYVPHEAIYVTTDPVAMDRIGWELVEQVRAEKKMPNLKQAGREPSYIYTAGDLGLGISDRERILLKEITL